ncbi:oxysterol-binding protein [Plectosphaerella plurivora]|uniref:Oxysterol-binding protein n=1 Tax=Plectosphaerella plurivora TaxID=936078 RepID=A0A9P8VLQ2_9PEZI|nr:oxysterol-binding protein [Plectosphaerella plurivora]
MAGIEQLEVHSKSYIVRWVRVDGGHTISWSVQPHKKSINFGIVKHPGSGNHAIAANTSEDPESPSGVTSGVNENKPSRFAKKDTITAQDLLANKGFISIKWVGRCEPEKVTMGTHDVPPGHGGMYGLVFDNTFSKQTSKTAALVLMTYPTGSPPQTNQNLPNLAAAMGSRTSLGRAPGSSSMASANINAVASDSVDSLHSHLPGGAGVSISGRSDAGSNNYFTGTLLKRRRKKGQGHARRYFSLDYSSCTLSYYYNRNSSALRGAIPLSLAAIAADERRREISIDSGAEIWHLRAHNAKDFTDWARALEKASRVARGIDGAEPTGGKQASGDAPPPLRVSMSHLRPVASNPLEDRDWAQVESLVSRTVGTRDALRRLVKDMAVAPKPTQPSPSSQFLSPSKQTPNEDADGYFPSEPQRRSFWKRKSSVTMASALAASSPAATPVVPVAANGHARKKSRMGHQEEKSMQDHCNALLNDLDSVITEFTALVLSNKRRRLQPPASAAASRLSMDTMSTDEFFDAEEEGSQIVRIHRSEEDDDLPDSDNDDGNVHDDSSVSSVEDDEAVKQDEQNCYPTKPKSLTPLPVDISVDRRTTIPPCLVPPPNVMSIVRKNVGKDLSTITMPVTANEPLSMLQRSAEQLEYAQLLDQAARLPQPKDRLLYMAAFAVSQFSNGRAKERAIRKPFNPLLGETFELLRTEQETPGGFRLLVEKVCHRPVRLAMQADSETWSFSQSPSPSQKFWGKSAEITTEGRVRVALRLPDGTDELYSWALANMFLRNVVMGEKYVEPVGTMQVTNDTTGAKALIEFRSKGMFGGRSEDVVVEIQGHDGRNTGTGLTGTWTSGLRRTEGGKPVGDEVWKVGRLVNNAATTYGMTEFSAGLNELTKVEEGRLPPTDTRLRPDQRAAEEGDFDTAEGWKLRLEEAQRVRRRDLEDAGEEYKPRWFYKVADGPEGEEVWKAKGGKESYWEERAKGQWAGVGKIFEADEL